MKEVLTTCQAIYVLICDKGLFFDFITSMEGGRVFRVTKKDLWDLAKRVLKFYKTKMNVTSDTYCVDIEALAGFLGYRVQNVSLGEDADIMGFTAFDPTVLDLSDQCGYPVSVAVDPNTIVLNDSIIDTCVGRYRFTLAHEVAHLILDMVYHVNYKVKYRSNPKVIKICRNNTYDYGEYIADRLASYLLILDNVLRIKFKEFFKHSRVDIISPFDNTGDYSRFCKIADYFGVSREALGIRLQQTEMLGKYYSYQHQYKLDVYPVA